MQRQVYLIARDLTHVRVCRIGNQAAPHFGNAAGFFNHAARKPRNVRTNKLLVGSFPVNAQQPGYKVPGIGNEAVPAHSHFDVGTNIVFVSFFLSQSFFTSPSHSSIRVRGVHECAHPWQVSHM